MTPKADLHCHSTYSDGSLSPTELVALAKEQNVSGLSITDHDSFSGFFEAENLGLDIIPGVELSTEFEKKSVHILGYAFNPKDQAFAEFCLKQRQDRLLRNREIIRLLSRQGLTLDEDDVVDSSDPNKTYGRVHIALALLKKGYIKEFHEAFRRYIGSNGSCYVAGNKCSTQEGIDAIHNASGKAVLAHPHILDSKSLTRRLLALNFDGIEAYYSRFLPNVNQHWVEVAQKKGLFVTGGSDFHGLPKPEVRLGATYCPQEVFDQLKAHYHELSRNA